MLKRVVSIKEATQNWVNGFNTIPQSILQKVAETNPEGFCEITPPSVGDFVYVFTDDYSGGGGEIVESCCNGDENSYLVKLDDTGENIVLSEEELEVRRYGMFPMWGAMWTFGETMDEDWLEDRSNLQKMADCGFRIYEQEDLRFVFGIDGAGYDFYEKHWIPLYIARGLRWHSED